MVTLRCLYGTERQLSSSKAHQQIHFSQIEDIKDQVRPKAIDQRVLSLGLSQGSFLVPLYREISRRLPGIQFDVLDFFKLGQQVEFGEEQVFRHFHETVPTRLNLALVSGLVRACSRSDLWKRIWWRFVTSNWSWRTIAHDISSAVRAADFRVRQQALGGYHLYHFQFCDAEHLQFIEVVPDRAKMICSFWGSDLMRTDGLYEYFYQKRALERADAITLQSIELREILLAKFGRYLSPKVHCVRHPLNEKFYKLMDELLNQLERVHEFRRELNIPKERLLITVGHNGNPGNNHLPIIDALSRLSASEKAAAIWVFPVKFLKNESHIRAVEKAATAAGLEFRLITHYLDWAELAAFRVATDILIHLPVSDALSGTVLEVLYSGNCVITGSWLPYSPFRQARLPLVTLEDLSELSSCVSKTLLRLPELKREATEAHQRIREHFFAEATAPPWVGIYRDLLGLSMSC